MPANLYDIIMITTVWLELVVDVWPGGFCREVVACAGKRSVHSAGAKCFSDLSVCAERFHVKEKCACAYLLTHRSNQMLSTHSAANM